MHEWGVASGIITKIKDAAKANGLKEVTAAEITLGKGLGIKEEEFRGCLEVLVKSDTALGNCCFRINSVDSNLAGLENIEGE